MEYVNSSVLKDRTESAKSYKTSTYEYKFKKIWKIGNIDQRCEYDDYSLTIKIAHICDMSISELFNEISDHSFEISNNNNYRRNATINNILGV